MNLIDMCIAPYRLDDKEDELHRWIISTAPHVSTALSFSMDLDRTIRRRWIQYAANFPILMYVYWAHGPWWWLQAISCLLTLSAILVSTYTQQGLLLVRKTLHGDLVSMMTKHDITPLEFVRALDAVAEEVTHVG